MLVAATRNDTESTSASSVRSMDTRL